MSLTGATKMGCPNCTGGWILSYVPANKDPHHLYGEDTWMLDYAEPCPICNGGEVHVETIQRKSNIPVNAYEVDMDGFDWDIYGCDTTMSMKMAKSFVLQYKEWKRRGIGLYIWSKVKGSGKTYLASAACNSLIKYAHARPKFVNVAKLIDLYQDKMSFDELLTCDPLVIDDIGQKIAGASWLNDILYELLNERMERRAVTLATSNYSLDELQLDDRVLDRLNAMMQTLHLPEFNVRTKDANRVKRQMLEELGVVEGGQEKFSTSGRTA